MFKANAFKIALVLVTSFALTGTALANDCRTQVSQPVVDYGNLNPSVLHASAKSGKAAELGTRHLQLNIVCTEDEDMAITFRSIAAGPQAFRLDDKGEFDLTLTDASLDGEPVLLGLVTSLGDVPADSAISVRLGSGQYAVPVKNHAVEFGKVFSVKVEISSRLYVDGLKLRDVYVMDGRGRFEVH